MDLWAFLSCFRTKIDGLHDEALSGQTFHELPKTLVASYDCITSSISHFSLFYTVKIGWMYRNTTLVALDNTIISSTANPYDIRKINILFVLNHAFKINWWMTLCNPTCTYDMTVNVNMICLCGLMLFSIF